MTPGDIKAELDEVVSKFNKVELFTCSVCGGFMNSKENQAGEGACYKCWGL